MLKGLNLIKQCRDLGFALSEIRALFGLVAAGYRCGDVRPLAEAQLDKVRVKLDELRSIEATLVGMIGRCGDPSDRDCTIVETLFVDVPSTGEPR